MLPVIMLNILPEFIKIKKLKDLFSLTADAFQCKVPEIYGLSYDEFLIKYALFTKEQAEKSILGGECLDELKSRLYENSYVYGQKLRKNLHIKNRKDAVKALHTAYKLIGIDFHCECYNDGCFRIDKCFFSNYYSKEVCKLISSLDEGLAAGLAYGIRLCFTHRITEGDSCCEGWLKLSDITGGYQ